MHVIFSISPVYVYRGVTVSECSKTVTYCSDRFLKPWLGLKTEAVLFCSGTNRTIVSYPKKPHDFCCVFHYSYVKWILI